MLDVILTLEEAANKLAPLCVQRSFLTLMDDALVDDELIFSDEQRESLAQEIAALFSAHDLEERLLIHLETGRINARSFLHDGRVFLNGKPAHKGVLVSLAEAEQALREHDHITFAEPPNTEEEPGGIADPMSEQVAATSAVPEQNEQAAPENNEPPDPGNDKPWQESARAIADECFDHDTNATPTVRDCLLRRLKNGECQGYAQRVMEIMQERKIHGPRGRITNASTVSREALQGDKWWATKAK